MKIAPASGTRRSEISSVTAPSCSSRRAASTTAALTSPSVSGPKVSSRMIPMRSPRTPSASAARVVRHGDAARERILGVVARDRLEHARRVFDGASERPGSVHRPAQRKRAVAGHTAPRRAKPDDAAERRGRSHRAAGVLAEGRGAEARGDRDTRARRRSAGIVVEIPRVPRLAERKLLRATEGELGQVQLAQQDAAGRVQARDRRRVLGRHVVFEDPRARRRADAGGVELILHRVGNAVERPERLAAHHGGFRPARRGERRFREAP